MKYSFITIEGCIGAGKTTLSSMLAKHFNARLLLEAFEENPFLPKFYDDPQHYGFPVELFFMAERFQKMKELSASKDLFGTLTISDYLFQKSLIFAGNNLQGDELKLYRMLFDIIYPNLQKPDLVLYLYADTGTLLRNIRKRGRGYEQNIKAEYLENIQQAYLDFFRQGQLQRVVLVRTDKMNFVENYFDFQRMAEIVSADFEPGIHYV